MKKKVILVTGTIQSNPKGIPTLSVNTTYMNAITAAGGIPVILGSPKLAEEYAELCDGLLITGGESVHPARFGKTFDELSYGDPNIAHNLKAGCNTVRDEMEFAAFHAFYKKKKPIMGICRGHQLVNAAFGGENMLNFPRRHRCEHSEGIEHRIVTEKGSFLARIYGESMLVNSFHRDCVIDVGEDILVSARSEDGIIEAIEHKILPIFSVQFHPERMRGETPFPLAGPDGTKIFEYFLSLCK